jgi:hypothetical protein
MSAVEGTRGTDNYFGIVVIVSLIGVALAALCFLGVRALARSLRRHSAPVVASPDEP